MAPKRRNNIKDKIRGKAKNEAYRCENAQRISAAYETKVQGAKSRADIQH